MADSFQGNGAGMIIGAVSLDGKRRFAFQSSSSNAYSRRKRMTIENDVESHVDFIWDEWTKKKENGEKMYDGIFPMVEI